MEWILQKQPANGMNLKSRIKCELFNNIATKDHYDFQHLCPLYLKEK